MSYPFTYIDFYLYAVRSKFLRQCSICLGELWSWNCSSPEYCFKQCNTLFSIPTMIFIVDNSISYIKLTGCLCKSVYLWVPKNLANHWTVWFSDTGSFSYVLWRFINFMGECTPFFYFFILNFTLLSKQPLKAFRGAANDHTWIWRKVFGISLAFLNQISRDFYWVLIGWFITLSVQTFQPRPIIYRKSNCVIINRDLYQFISQRLFI